MASSSFSSASENVVINEKKDAITQSPAALSVEDQLETVFRLLQARASGQATNDEVEAAVSGMLQAAGAGGNAAGATSVSTTNSSSDKRVSKPYRKQQPVIEADEENYDNDDEEVEKGEKRPIGDKSRAFDSVSKRARVQPSTDAADHFIFDASLYEDIPLGRQGAQMMTTFGDGRQPHPETVSTTLLGARRMLQTAIQDARVLRRQQRQLYQAAKEVYQQQKPNPLLMSQSTPQIMYRALSGYDTLAYDQKSGFDVDQLQQLFPEEMNAYRRWNEMHEQAEVKGTNAEHVDEVGIVVDNDNEVVQDAKDQEADGDNKVVGMNEPVNDTDASEVVGGHLRERLAQFDVRTDRMKEDWYMKFATLRQGSFLPRHYINRQADLAWGDSRSGRRGPPQCGRPSEHGGPSWRQLGLVAVRFLHWVGFDPQSALPPPNDDTINALAFLAYDFFGRIVEKAIFLRNLEKKKKELMKSNLDLSVDETNIVLELDPGEQLEESDIERAMEDPDIKPCPLFSARENGDKGKVGPQLYFGPGFEERLEMELDELLTCHKKQHISPEELKVRQEEDAFFERLSAPPEMSGVASLLDMETGDNYAVNPQRALNEDMIKK